MYDNYDNTYCPERCDIAHPVPIGHVVGTFTCPCEGDTYYWCDECNDWYYAVATTHDRINGQWMCDPTDHEYERCATSGCSRWLDEGQRYQACYNDNDWYCAVHWDGCDCPDCNEPYEYDNDNYDGSCDCGECRGGGGCEGEERNACPTCKSWDDNLDLLTEEFWCACSVKAILLVDPDHPFRLALPLNQIMGERVGQSC